MTSIIINNYNSNSKISIDIPISVLHDVLTE